MAGKVIHIGDRHHLMAKNYCKENRVQMSVWISSLIYEGVQKNIRPKNLQELSESDIYGASPFWEKTSLDD